MKLIKKIRILLTGINSLLCVIVLLMSRLYVQGLNVIAIPVATRMLLTILIIVCPILGLVLSILTEAEEMNDNDQK